MTNQRRHGWVIVSRWHGQISRADIRVGKFRIAVHRSSKNDRLWVVSCNGFCCHFPLGTNDLEMAKDLAIQKITEELELAQSDIRLFNLNRVNPWTSKTT